MLNTKITDQEFHSSAKDLFDQAWLEFLDLAESVGPPPTDYPGGIVASNFYSGVFSLLMAAAEKGLSMEYCLTELSSVRDDLLRKMRK